jgi:DNA-directed RNA polymerase III subunit RPC1
MTIRTSTNDIVQFTYGGDSLDPIYLEGKDRPVDYDRIYHHVRAKYRYDNEYPLNGNDMITYVCQQLALDEYSIMEQEYKQQLVDFIQTVAKVVDRNRTRYHIDGSMPMVQNENNYSDNDNDNDNEQTLKSNDSRKRSLTSMKFVENKSMAKKQRTISNVLHEIERCTKSQLLEFLQLCKHKYGRARLEPGTAVGALCAQSIGEPATQMTLKSTCATV